MPDAHRITPLICTALLALGTSTAFGQAFPNRPLRIITSEIGGSSDLVARVIAQGLTASLGQQVLVDNRAGGSIAGEAVLKSPPDGHTLIYYGNALWILPLMRKDVPYDTVRDFAPITQTATSPSILVVHPSLPVKTVKELVALAKARPGALNYGSPAAGTTTHLAAELFNAMAGVNIVRIAYKGVGSALNDLLGGHVQLMFAPAGAVALHVRSGKLRALAVTTARTSAAFPDLPTMAAAGVSGYEAESIFGMWAPGKTPGAVVNRLNQEIVKVLAQPEVKDRLTSLGLEVVAGSAEEFSAKIKSEVARMGKLVQDTGIRDQ